VSTIPSEYRARRWLGLASVVAVGVLLALVVVQFTSLSLLGIGTSPAPTTCVTPNDTTSSAWTPWQPRSELPFGLYDPVLFVEPEREYPYRLLVAPDDGEMNLYKSRSMQEYDLVASDVEGPQFASNFNWGRKVDGQYYLFRTLEEERTELWTGDSLTNLTNRGVVLDEADTGGFYDPETGVWHIYYQKERPGASDDRFGPTTDLLIHATSRDARNWTRQGVALNVSGEPWKTGDPDVVQVGDRYYMFVDQTTEHPVYHIHLAVSENLSQFETVGRVTDTCGGDAKVRYMPDSGSFVMLTEFAGDDISGVGVSVSGGPENRSYRTAGRGDIVTTTDNETG